MRIVAGLLLCLTTLLFGAPAYADPPEVGTTGFAFADPVFTQVVVCDTVDQIESIVRAPAPSDVFLEYFHIINESGEPVCIAALVVADVIDVKPLGIMKRDGLTFNAWAIQITESKVGYWLLYLEKIEIQNI